MSEDRFYQNVRSTMSEYHPEAPASVYEGMRKKLWWSNFTRLSVTRFNIWYVALILGTTVAVLSQTSSVVENNIQPKAGELNIPSTQLNSIVSSAELPAEAETLVVAEETEKKKQESNTKLEGPTTTLAQEPTEEQTDEVKTDVKATENTVEIQNPEVKPEAAAPAQNVGTKRGLKVKTYNSGQDKK